MLEFRCFFRGFLLSYPLITSNTKNNGFSLLNTYNKKNGVSNSALYITKIYSTHSYLANCEDHKENNAEYFGQYSVCPSILQDNPWIFKIPAETVQKRINILNKMNLKCIEHGIPFLNLSEKSLLKLLNQTTADQNVIPGSNRLYYISEKLKVDPYLASGYISKRLFIYSLAFENLKGSLETMLELGVKPHNILRDLWSLNYNKDIIRERLEYVANVKSDRLMPWMIRCPEKVLQRSLHLRTTTKEILGNDLSPPTYLAQRLKTTPDTINKMSTSTNSIKTTRVSKMKEVIDFLLDNGYAEEDIIEVPKIFAHSLRTIIKRKKILDDLGVKDQTLKVFCRSQKDFLLYCKQVESHFRKTTK